MINNAQLDNEKAALRHQVDLLKDEAEEMEEKHALLHRDHRETYRVRTMPIEILHMLINFTFAFFHA